MSTAVLRTTRPLTAGEARDLTDRIRGAAEKLSSLLQEAYDRGAWAALGYSSWREYATTELSITKSQAYRLLDQARVIAAIQDAAGFPPRGENVDLSERDTRALKPVLQEVVEEIRERVVAGEEPAAALKAVVGPRQEARLEQRREEEAHPEYGSAEDHEPDPAEELKHALAESHRLSLEVEELRRLVEAEDLGTELVTLRERYARLEGRVHQLMTTGQEAEREAKRRGTLLREIRGDLAVERDSQIREAIRSLRREAGR